MRLVGGAVVAAAVVSLVAPASAFADIVTVTDPVLDAPARFDIRSVRVTNDEQTLTHRARFRLLRPQGAQIAVINATVRESGAHALVQSVRRPNGRVFTRFSGDVADGCVPTSTWEIRRRLVTISLPKSCLDGGGLIDTSFAVGAGTGNGGDPWDWTETISVEEG